jgi:hypothetical protein
MFHQFRTPFAFEFGIFVCLFHGHNLGDGWTDAPFSFCVVLIFVVQWRVDYIAQLIATKGEPPAAAVEEEGEPFQIRFRVISLTNVFFLSRKL